MLIHSAGTRSARMDLGLAVVMSLVAGALNVVGFLVAGSFSANMTGNVSVAADHLAERDLAAALPFVLLLVAFVAGAVLSALVIQGGMARGVIKIHAWVVLAEALVLMALAAAGLDGVALVAVLSLLMGAQNATTTLISAARVRTTHVSGMATDIGIELAALTGGACARAEAMPRLILHLLSLLAFTGGGVAGALLWWAMGHGLLILAGGILLALAIPFLARRAG